MIARPRTFTLESIARAICVASPKTVRARASRPFDPLRLWRLAGKVFVYADRTQLWLERERESQGQPCSQPIARGLLAIGDIVGLKDDEALLKLVRRSVDPIPTWYDGGTICGYVPAVEDWCEANRELAVMASGDEREPNPWVRLRMII